MLRGNQHGGCKYDDLQNWLDMTSLENPLLRYFFLLCMSPEVVMPSIPKVYVLKREMVQGI